MQGTLEEVEEDESGLTRTASKASKASHSRRAEGGRIRRKGTLTHARDSIRSSKSLTRGGGIGRSDNVRRKKSTQAGVEPKSTQAEIEPASPLVVRELYSSDSPEAEVQLEMVTVHSSKTEEV